MSTKDKIVEAAAWLFAEKGYDGMTMKEIANRVGITPPAVYAFYKNKEDVFIQIYNEVLKGHLAIAFDHLAESESHNQTVKEQFEKFLLEIVEYQSNEPLQMKIYMRLLLFPPDVFEKNLKNELLDLVEKEEELFSAIFDKGIKIGEVKEGDSKVYAKALICLMDGLFWEMQRMERDAFKERFYILWEHFWQGVKK